MRQVANRGSVTDMNWKKLVLFNILLLVMQACSVNVSDYDTVILNGRVIDPETQFDQVANIGIVDGVIVEMTTKEIEGKETIDASGQVVTAGFIDVEQHGLGPWGIKVNLRDGVTTQMDLELGALNIAEWYQSRIGKTQANFGTVVSQELARMRVHDELKLAGPNVSMPYAFDYRAQAAKDGVDGWSLTRSNLQQLNAINRILDEGLRQGALGIGSTIGYAQKGITSFEMYTAQKLAASYGRLTSVHHRFHPSAATPTESAIGVDEILSNAMALNAPLQVHHDNDYGWWENQEKLALARQQGYNVWATWYPWGAGSGNAGASILKPETWKDAMGYKYEETIYDPINDRFLSEKELLALANKDPGYTLIAYSPKRREWMPEWLKLEHFIVASDGMPGLDANGGRIGWDAPYNAYVGHPRTAGSHARVLRLGREQGVPLMHSLAQLSYWPAKHLGDAGVKAMQVRGRLQKGMVADIVIFDAENVREEASYKVGSNGLPSSGIPYVLVNGTVVVRNSKVLKDRYPGQPIRCAVEKKGRFEPINSELLRNAYK